MQVTDEKNLHESLAVAGMYENWFLEYASYVILERAVPAIEDGLKPVQRRILHALNEMDDGRFNKVANVIGSTMQYHPHGDASIGDALVGLGQKDLVFDMQGNWGDVRTGDSAAAARYIEVRLSKFAKDVVFNPDLTLWQQSYDGRKKEPITLPVKFPLLLAQGVEGIAVGLSTKILPHNFCELIEASIDILKEKPFQIFPDFLTGGQIDVLNYNDGLRGGKVRVRAKIEELDKKTLVIREIPFGTTTVSLMDSIVKANDLGKIKIKKVIDNTAKSVEIQIQLAIGTSPDITIDALYAFTECEVSISPNACIIIGEKPHFCTISEILRTNTQQTLHFLEQELEIRKHELLEKLLYASLEKIFIENRIYRDIEECETWESVIRAIDTGLEPFKKDFYRDITEDDILKLTEIRIKRISKYDAFKADELMRRMEEELAEVEDNLRNIVRFAIGFFKDLLKKYGKGRERKTEIQQFNAISANVVAAANQKLYVNREEGFIGYGLKKDEFISDCSDIDDVIVFRKDGKCLVVKIQEKIFVGKEIMYCAVFKKGDDRRVFNVAYLDGKSGVSYAKRFKVTAVTRDREYDLTQGNKKSKILYFSANDNGEAELIQISLTASSTAKVKQFEFDFSKLAIKNRDAMGNILTKYPVRKVEFRKAGISTLGGVDIWYDATIGRLNRDEHGKYLGNFEANDAILVLYKNGTYELTSFEMTNRYEPKEIAVLVKYIVDGIVTAVHFDGEKKNYFAKRFRIETLKRDEKYSFIAETKGSRLEAVTTDVYPRIEVQHKAQDKAPIGKTEINLDELVDVRGWKALGSKLVSDKIVAIKLLEPRLLDQSGENVPLPSEIIADENSTEDNEQPVQLGLFQ